MKKENGYSMSEFAMAMMILAVLAGLIYSFLLKPKNDQGEFGLQLSAIQCKIYHNFKEAKNCSANFGSNQYLGPGDIEPTMGMDALESLYIINKSTGQKESILNPGENSDIRIKDITFGDFNQFNTLFVKVTVDDKKSGKTAVVKVPVNFSLDSGGYVESCSSDQSSDLAKSCR